MPARVGRVGSIGADADGGIGRRVENPPVALRTHDRPDGTHQRIRTDQVGLKMRADPGVIESRYLAWQGSTRDVGQHVDATEGTARLLDDRARRLEAADRHSTDRRRTAALLDLARRGFGEFAGTARSRALVRNIIDQHARAAPCQLERDGPTDAAPGSGHDGDLIVEFDDGHDA